MKSVLTFLAVASLTVTAFAGQSKDELRLKIARSTEVQSLSEAYKKQGYKCMNTVVQSINNGEVKAYKVCNKSFDDGTESGISMQIEAELFEEDLIIKSINFIIAG